MRSKRSKPGMVREPVMVYLDAPDRDLLSQMANTTGLPKTELLRRGLRRLAAETLREKKPGWSFDLLAGLITDGPTDVSERHDEYLAAEFEKRRGKPRAR